MPEMRGHQIRRRILYLSAVAFILLCLFSFFFIALPLFSQLQDAENKNIVHAAETRALALQQWQQRAIELTNQVASRSAIRKKLESYINGQTTFADLQTFTRPKLADAVNYTDEIVGIQRTTSDGKTIASYGLQIPKEQTRYYKSSSKAPTISFPVLIKGRHLVAIQGPIFGSDQTLLGHDQLTLVLDDINNILTNREGLGEKSSVLLFYTNDSFHFPFTPGDSELTRDFLHLLNQPALIEEISQTSFMEGDRLVVSRSPLVDDFWGLFVVQDKDELYASIRQQLMISLALGFLATAFVLYWLLRIISPLTDKLLLQKEELQEVVRQKTTELNHQVEEKEQVVQALTELRHDLEATNKKLHHLSITDDLTQLKNRRKISEILHQEVSLCQRYKTPFSVIMVDIDHFKRVNDRYGHTIGDQILVQVANILNERIRAVDMFGRWGGEEFLIVLPETELEGACQLAEQLRQAVEGHPLAHNILLTCSLGVSAYQKDEELSALLNRVDTAMYQAKDGGRNRVVAL